MPSQTSRIATSVRPAMAVKLGLNRLLVANGRGLASVTTHPPNAQGRAEALPRDSSLLLSLGRLHEARGRDFDLEGLARAALPGADLLVDGDRVPRRVTVRVDLEGAEDAVSHVRVQEVVRHARARPVVLLDRGGKRLVARRLRVPGGEAGDLQAELGGRVLRVRRDAEAVRLFVDEDVDALGTLVLHERCVRSSLEVDVRHHSDVVALAR